MKKYMAIILAILILTTLHEGAHVVLAMAFDEFKAFYGIMVEYKTPIAEREGIKWGFIAGTSSIATLLLGYILFVFRVRVSCLKNLFLRLLGYFLTFFSLILDALNLSIGPFLYGGDIGGIVVGFGINQYLVQIVFFVIFMLNRELIIQKLFPLYGVKTKHPLFQPLIVRK